MRIQVVCGAGASSTFIAGRLRRAAVQGGDDWDVQAAPVDALDGFADVILLGPHLAHRQEEISLSVPRSRVVVLPEDAFTDLEGTRVRSLVRDAVATAEKGTP